LIVGGRSALRLAIDGPIGYLPGMQGVRVRAPAPREERAPSLRQRLLGRLFEPVDIASLVYFRIAFGAIMLIEVWRYFSHGWIEEYFMDPIYHFTWGIFDWVRPWPDQGMYLHFVALGLLATLIILGAWYRPAAALFTVGFAYIFLLEKARYLNHFYLISLVALIMIFVPANRAFSVDVVGRRERRSDTAPAWALWLIRAQLGIAYLFGGLAKLNGDWLAGQPLRMWLAGDTDFPIIGPLFTEEWMVYLMSWGSLLFDLLIVPALLWRRTRPFAFGIAVVFNLMNWKLFSIGIFPWMMIAGTAMFFPPSWPRTLLGLGRSRTRRSSASRIGPLRRSQRVTVGLLAGYLAVQVLVPLRHFLYPGNVSWTEEGHRFSWHMKLRDKEATAEFVATDPATGQTWEIDPLNTLNEDQYDEMSTRPDMILQLSHHFAEQLRAQGYERIQVRARVMASLNGRRPQLLIDPAVDLAAEDRSLLPADWIMPLRQPLRTP
jgi:vitamin K-dependent gamma-carboxylase